MTRPRRCVVATEPDAAPDCGRVAVSRDIRLLRRPRQVSLVVGRT